MVFKNVEFSNTVIFLLRSVLLSCYGNELREPSETPGKDPASAKMLSRRRKVSIGLRLICTKVAFLLDTFQNTMEEQSCTSFVEMEELEAEQEIVAKALAYHCNITVLKPV
ncbi:uncharacterized protein LOC130049772 [Ostrea edulis]|uniref:uncharacterized protein LOC130049772 n=1 Tax=Ostrea edulis TaxID=37623 RepID=UPI0024AE9FD0|nr:uncharacterized protein LOC130049772 [Ostrea edulis]